MNFLTLIIEAISQNQSDEEIQKLSHGHESAIRSEIDALLNADSEKLLRILFPAESHGGQPLLRFSTEPVPSFRVQECFNAGNEFMDHLI